MLLVGTNGNRLELTVAGYESPTFEDNASSDSDWLIVTADVLSERGSWTASDPSLLTSEVECLADWMDDVAGNLAEDAEIGFIEPNLSFRLDHRSKEDIALRVRFGAECRPPWAPADDRVGEPDLWVCFEVRKDDLHRAAQDLRAQLHEFPPRVRPD